MEPHKRNQFRRVRVAQHVLERGGKAMPSQELETHVREAIEAWYQKATSQAIGVAYDAFAVSLHSKDAEENAMERFRRAMWCAARVRKMCHAWVDEGMPPPDFDRWHFNEPPTELDP
jgi:hypothetical protein